MFCGAEHQDIHAEQGSAAFYGAEHHGVLAGQSSSAFGGGLHDDFESEDEDEEETNEEQDMQIVPHSSVRAADGFHCSPQGGRGAGAGGGDVVEEVFKVFFLDRAASRGADHRGLGRARGGDLQGFLQDRGNVVDQRFVEQFIETPRVSLLEV